MGNYNTTITQKGKELLTKVQSGQMLSFTKFKTGDGVYVTGEDLKAVTKLRSEKQEFEIGTIEVKDKTTVRARTIITNMNLEEGYTLKEFGLFAIDPEEGEILYCITIAEQDKWDYIPREDSTYPTTLTVDVHLIIANAENIKIEALGVGMATTEDISDIKTILQEEYYTKEEMNDKFGELRALAYEDTVTDAQIIDVAAVKILQSSTYRFVSDEQIAGFLDKYTKADIDTKLGALGGLAYLDQVGNSQITDIQAAKVTQNNTHRFVTDSQIILFSDKYTKLETDVKFGSLGALAYLDRVADAQITGVTAAKVAESSSRRFVTDAEKANYANKYTKNEIDNLFSTLETDTDWKEAVATFADIAKTYPNPQDGWTVNTRDTDYTYRYSGAEWIAISANAIPKATATVDGLMGIAEWVKLNGIAANANNYVHPTSGVTAGTFQRVTVNAQGHVTGGNNNTVTLAEGGTGATTAAAARTNLGVPATSHASTSTTHGVSTANNYGHAKASNATPLAPGTATAGTDNGNYAREGHVHPLQVNTSGNAGSSTKLQNARTINGTAFDGTANIITANWGTARNITIANSDGTNAGTAVSVNGSGNAALRLPSVIKAALTGNADTASKLLNARTIALSGAATGTATAFDGTSNITIAVTGLNMGNANAGTLAIARGGTGATTAAAAWTNLVRQGGEITGQLILSRTTGVDMGASSEGALVIGNKTGAHLAFDGNKIMAKASATTSNSIWLNPGGGLVGIGPGGLRLGGNLQMYNATSTRTSTVLDIRGATDTNGDALLISAGGLTVIGGGESPQAFFNLGTVNPEKEDLYLTADDDIVFLVNCNTIANRIGLKFSKAGNLSPTVNNALDLGTSSLRFNKVHTTTLESPLNTGTFIKGNQGEALLNSTANAGNYVALFKTNSTNGHFMMANHAGNLRLMYTSKATVDAGTNNVTYSAILLNESGNTEFPGDVTARNFRGNADTATRLAASSMAIKIDSAFTLASRFTRLALHVSLTARTVHFNTTIESTTGGTLSNILVFNITNDAYLPETDMNLIGINQNTGASYILTVDVAQKRIRFISGGANTTYSANQRISVFGSWITR